MVSKALWGEIPTLSDTDSGIAAIEREQMTKPRSIEVEGPRLHQPSSRHYPPTSDPLPAERFQLDPLTSHTIKLVQHAKKVRQLISNIHQQQQDNVRNGDNDITYPAAPPIPEYTGPQLKHKTLTDITHEYFQQITTHLRSAADNRLLNGYTGFPDLIEQVFHEIGLGSVKCLHDFYQSHIIAYHENMEHTCQQLMSEYEKIKLPIIQKQPDTVPVIRIKEEPCSEIQFPVLDENDDLNETEQLLNLDALGGFEITVEHESASGLTTEQHQGSVKPPHTPAQMSEGGDSIVDPPSVSGSDIMSPPSITSRPKRNDSNFQPSGYI
ncbi:hypothetical protein KUTeg_024519 [Tegillarca granosa]|uniref:STAGA complex 65 subunit gamma n=1 Tax=Tegillarca granosa TaxID=220873 RepID=A0ABQ9E3W3_TEGGR|nr:hypothetical protein KUTeg_024519 [Tegillarca granosa]